MTPAAATRRARRRPLAGTLLAAGGLAAAAAALWLAAVPGLQRPPAPLTSPGLADTPTAPVATPVAPAADGQAEPTAAHAQALLRQVFETGSLRGASPDGGWGLDAQGRLQPNLALRRRFDQWLSTLGELTVPQITAVVRQQALQDLGADGAAQVMAVWQNYLALQQHPWQVALDGHDLRLWSAALAERQRVRRERLGMAWAEAFYRDEETALQQRLAQQARPAGEPGARTPESAPTSLPDSAPGAALPVLPALAQAPAAGTDAQSLFAERSAAFGPEAALRLQAEDEAQAAWDRRLQQARAQVAALAAAPEFSPPQRAEAIMRWLDAHFSGSERLRAGALLGR